MKGWTLTDWHGNFVYQGTLDEMFDILFGIHCEAPEEEQLFGPIRQLSDNDGGQWIIHPEGIRAPGATYEEGEKE